MALGVFAGFFVPTGGQIAIAIFLAIIFKANKALAITGTFITNPYTATFFMPAECWIGAIIMGSPLKMSEIEGNFSAFMGDPTWQGLLKLGAEFLIPLLIGGVVFSIIFSIPSYYLTLWLVNVYKGRRANKLLKKSQARQVATDSK